MHPRRDYHSSNYNVLCILVSYDMDTAWNGTRSLSKKPGPKRWIADKDMIVLHFRIHENKLNKLLKITWSTLNFWHSTMSWCWSHLLLYHWILLLRKCRRIRGGSGIIIHGNSRGLTQVVWPVCKETCLLNRGSPNSVTARLPNEGEDQEGGGIQEYC